MDVRCSVGWCLYLKTWYLDVIRAHPYPQFSQLGPHLHSGVTVEINADKKREADASNLNKEEKMKKKQKKKPTSPRSETILFYTKM